MRIGPAVVEDIFSRAGAYLEGHFLLSSGRHSPYYLEKFQVLQWPQETERLCAGIAESARVLGPQTVAGPTTGGIILAHEVARQLGLRAVYAERAADGHGREFRRGFRLAAGERVLVVDDIMSTGGSVHETIDAVRASGAEIVGVGVLVDRSDGEATFGQVPLIALWQVSIPSYTPAACPQCGSGVPLLKPGTTPAPAVAV
ncbi:MAG TPA: orotate phosphoribosyltransferase [Candidatus Limnocylindria bacterium]|nr:orotate phosphoribosyltransferase [Candidatus Limnocylindria bacterium]